MKLILALCFFCAICLSTGTTGHKCPKPKCKGCYTYQPVQDMKGKTIYGCVPSDQCSKGLTSRCSSCCADYSNCTEYLRFLGGPLYRCNKCKTGVVKSCDECCEKYGYKCEVFVFIRGEPILHCIPPKTKGKYFCGEFCPKNSYCGIMDGKKKPPYFYCLY